MNPYPTEGIPAIICAWLMAAVTVGIMLSWLWAVNGGMQ